MLMYSQNEEKPTLAQLALLGAIDPDAPQRVLSPHCKISKLAHMLSEPRQSIFRSEIGGCGARQPCGVCQVLCGVDVRQDGGSLNMVTAI